jgi:ferric-dicitrate binding protein FerR (iron transport regulator)
MRLAIMLECNIDPAHLGSRLRRGMTGRSARGRWERVLAARRQARAALGRDPNVDSLYEAPPKREPVAAPTLRPSNPERPPERPDQSVGVLTLGEAAIRLGVSCAELEALIASGQVDTLPIEFGRVVPRHEVERLLKAAS